MGKILIPVLDGGTGDHARDAVIRGGAKTEGND